MNELQVAMLDELSTLEFIQPDFELEAFNGGTINSSYSLKTSNQRYFVKTFESDKIANLDRIKLFDIQTKLAAKGLAVKPVYLSKSLSFQIDQWLDSPTLDEVGESSLIITKGLANALSKLHKIEIDAPSLDLPSQWQHYLKLIDAPISGSMQRTLETYGSTWQQACADNKVFCHNDLALSHVTHDDANKIFDWEYCAISCPYFDIASCVAVNGFSCTNEASLCTFYAQYSEQRLSEVIDKVSRMKPLVELTYKLWYQAARLSS